MAYIPYGYRIRDGMAQIDTREQKQLEILYEAFSHGETYKDSLIKSEIPKSLSGIRAVIRDRTYRGTAFYPRMLDDALIEAADRELERRAESGHRRGRKKRQAAGVWTSFTFPASPLRRKQGESRPDYMARIYASVTAFH